MTPVKKEMSDQTRAVIAAALSLIVIVGYSMFYKSAPPPPTPNTRTITINPSLSGANGAAASGANSAAPAVAASSASAPTTPPVAGSAEQTVVVESDLYHIEFSSKGAVVHSWQLKKFTDESTPPRTLDLVNADAARALGGWPFALVLDNSTQESAANNALFEVKGAPASGATLQAPAELTFVWSDGHLQVTKHLQFDNSYIVKVQTSVQMDGKPLTHSLSWRGGFGDVTIVSRRGAVPMQVFSSQDGKFDTLAAAKLGQPKQTYTRITQPGPFDNVGIEDLYFTAAFLPPLTPSGQLPPAGLTLTDWAPERDTTTADGKTTKTLFAEMAAGSASAGPLDFRIYVGPKGIDGLKAVRPPLNGLVQFGWFTIIAEPLFYALRWVHDFVPNYGWAIVLFAVAINTALFPLKAMGMRAAQKMQRVAPEIKSIQEKYKKYAMRDPRKAEMNKEVMAVYAREGINPLGSCWPQLIQFPIWFAVYRMLEYTIELRGAPWILWIHDLSAPDPHYTLPILLGLTGYLQTKLTPMPGTDPAQARMMTLMPLVFGFLFIFYPSGLSLYILGSYAVGISQQIYLNRTSPLKPPRKAKKK